METVWFFRLGFIGILSAMFLVAVFLAIPKALKYYSLWKKTREEKHIAVFFSDLFLAIFMISGVFAVGLKTAYFLLLR